MSDEEKQKIAVEAARLLAGQGVLDYRWARAKAAEQLGVTGGRNLPELSQVEVAFSEYQQLFRPQDRECLILQRRAIIEVMKLFSAFSSRLVGPVSRNICAPNAAIRIHLFADSAKEVLFVLFDEGISYRSHDVTISPKSGVRESYPAFEIEHDAALVEIVVLPLSAIHHPPIDAVTGKVERGVSLEQLEEMS